MRSSILFALSLSSLLGPLLSDAAGAEPPRLLQAGPMLGHVGPKEVLVWVRTKKAAALSGRLHQESLPEALPHAELQDHGSGFTVMRFQDASLRPNTPFQIDLLAARPGFPTESARLEGRTAPEVSTSGKLRIAFGSCSKLSQYRSGPIYQAIAEERPDMAIFLGDNAYFIVGDGSEKHFSTTGPFGDWTTKEGMLARHLVTRMHPDLTQMLRSVPSYAVWDDHDYGPDNADTTFPLKEEAREAFIAMWANPGYGMPGLPGVFSNFRHGPVEIFLMDNRSYKYSPQKHDDVTPENGRIWGEDQLHWLLNGLHRSTAPVKVIANGTQFLSLSDVGEGHFQEAKGERRRLLAFLEEHQIGGVVILSGDRHYSEAMQQSQSNGETLVVECTSSPLQQNQKVEPFTKRQHPNQLWAMLGNNFGLLTVDLTAPGEGSIRFETRDEQNRPCVAGDTICATTWTLERLNY